MHIALIYSTYENLDQNLQNINPHGASQMGATTASIRKVLEESGHSVTSIEANNDLLNQVEKIENADLIFNLSTGILDKRSQANIVGLLEMTGIPMLGSGLISHVVALHKEMTKSLLDAHGIRTARFQLISEEDQAIREDFIYPLIVKPEHEGSGIGVTDSSKVDSPDQLQAITQEKISLYHQVLLIEEFLPGREFTVGVLGNKTLEILPIQETIFSNEGTQMLTAEMKYADATDAEIPANLTKELNQEIREMTEKTYRVLRCRDFARIDFRLDHKGRPHVIELNTFPGLQKDYSFFPTIAKVAGYSYSDLIQRLVEVALEPRGLQ